TRGAIRTTTLPARLAQWGLRPLVLWDDLRDRRWLARQLRVMPARRDSLFGCLDRHVRLPLSLLARRPLGGRRSSGAEKGQQLGLVLPNSLDLRIGEPARGDDADAVVARVQTEALSRQLGEKCGGRHISSLSSVPREGSAIVC